MNYSKKKRLNLRKYYFQKWHIRLIFTKIKSLLREIHVGTSNQL